MALTKALEKGDVPPSRRLEEHLSTCLLCMACEEVCTNETPVVDIVEAARAVLAKAKGVSLPGRCLKRILEDKTLAHRLVSVGILTRPLWGRKVEEYRGIALRIPLLKELGLMPPVEVPYSREAPVEQGTGNRGTVALFLGCLLEYVYPSIAEATVAILSGMGYRVIIPEGQGCCGHPHLAMGDKGGAERLKERNTRVLESSGAHLVVTACATCTAHLKRHYRLSIPVKDVAELLLEVGPGGFRYKLAERATYHQPCHLGRGQGIKGVPSFLRALLGSSFVEMAEFERCCGFGGSAAWIYPQVSLGVGKVKARHISQTGCGVVLTDCPACILQINRCLAMEGIRSKALHIVEAIDFRLREVENNSKETTG